MSNLLNERYIPFTWDVSRICCPSQGYFYFFDDNGAAWVLYIRWRSAPWSAELIPVFDIEEETWDWENEEIIKLSKIYEEEEECEEVMKESYEWLKKRFPDIDFPESPRVCMHPFPVISIEDLDLNLGKN